MKNIFKNVALIVVLFVSLFSVIKISYAFPQMDVCNYTYWDSSGDYYDGLCTEDWKPSEDTTSILPVVETIIEVKEEKTDNLTEVNHKTGASYSIGNWYNDILSDSKIIELEEQLAKANLLLEKYKNTNIELVENQKILLEKEQNLLLEESLDTVTSIKKTIKYEATPMEDITVDQAVLDLIRERIERSNLRNAEEQKN